MTNQLSNRGHVKWYNETKGYGFIIKPDGSDIFVHAHALKFSGLTTLHAGQLVDFEIGSKDGRDYVATLRILTDPVNPVVATQLTDMAKKREISRSELVRDWIAAQPEVVTSLLFRLVFMPISQSELALDELCRQFADWAITTNN